MSLKKYTIAFLFLIAVLSIVSAPPARAAEGDERVRKAQIYLQSGDYREAARILESVLKGDPGDIDAVYLLGLAYSGLKETEKAAELFEKCISRFPDFEDSYIQLAAIQAGNKEFHKSEQTLDKLIKQKPKSATAHYAKGVLYYVQQKTNEAIGEFNRTIMNDKNFSLAYANLGFIFYNLDKTEEAIKNFYEAARLDDSNPEFPFALGWIQRKAGKKAEAYGLFSKSSGLNPPHVFSAMSKAIKAFDEGKYDEADEYLKEVFIMQPDFAKGLFLKAQILYNKDNKKEATDILKKLLSEDPLDIDAKSLMEKIK